MSHQLLNGKGPGPLRRFPTLLAVRLIFACGRIMAK